MAAFSSHHHGSFMALDLGYVPNTSNNMYAPLEGQIINTTPCFSSIQPTKYFQESPLHADIHETSDSLHTIKVPIANSNSSSTTAELEAADQRVTHLQRKRKTMGCEVGGEGKCKRTNKCDTGMPNSKNGEEKKKKKVPEEAPTGYVHVRARRGQATDSHSLAERVRREKISERMRLLQSLVPGCDKIIGKALILDEIINHVQTLQSQVEFLVMKLASVYPTFDYLDTNISAPEELDGYLFGDMDNQTETLVNHCGPDNLYPY